MAWRRVVVLDTQILMEVIAPADLYREIDRDRGLPPAVRERQRRTAYSLALAWQFHIWATRTLFHDDEVIRIIQKIVPPETPTYTVSVVSLFAHDLRDAIFTNWKWRTSPQDLPPHLQGTKVDDALLACAKKMSVPLLTRDAPLTAKAKQARVAVFESWSLSGRRS